MIDFILIFIFVVSGLIAIVLSFIEVRKILIINLFTKLNHTGFNESEEGISIENFAHYVDVHLADNEKMRNKGIPVRKLTTKHSNRVNKFLKISSHLASSGIRLLCATTMATLLICLVGVLIIGALFLYAGTTVNIEPDINPSSTPNTDPIDHQGDDIHSFVLEYSALFKNDIAIDWESYRMDEEQRYYLENGLSETGISISYFDSDEEDIDWDALYNDGIGYVLVRIGGRGYDTGKIYLDKKYTEYMEAATETGIKVGCYFYSQAISQAEADEEIEQIVKSVAGYKDVLDYPIGISFERGKRTSDLSAEECIDLVKYICIRLLQAGYIPMIIGGTEWYEQFPAGTFSGYLKLVSSKEPPRYIDNCIIWEYDDNAKNTIAGVKNAVELSVSTYGLLG